MNDYMTIFDGMTEKQQVKIMEAYKTYHRIKNDHVLNEELTDFVYAKYYHLLRHENSLSQSLRQMNNALYDATTASVFWTGLYSLRLVESIKKNGLAVCGASRAQFDNSEKKTEEHAAGRNSVSEMLIKSRNILTFKQFLVTLFTFCFVHYTTVDENSMLGKAYQAEEFKNWMDCYESSGMILCSPVFEKQGYKKNLIDEGVLDWADIRKNMADNPYYYKYEVR